MSVRFAPLLLVLVCAALALGSYLQAFSYPFIFDDSVFITNNSRLATLPWYQLWRVFTEPYNTVFEFLPLRDLSFWLDMALSGQASPSVPRLDNILLYLLSLPLVYAATLSLWRYFRPADAASAPWAAAVVTALFALHPALVESVVWVTGRKYILPNLFSLLALWLATKVKLEGGFSSKYATATLLAFVAVMFSKSSYVAVAPLVAMLWLVFWLDIPPQQRRRSLLLWPCTILLLAGVLTLIFITQNKGYDTVPAYYSMESVVRSLAALGWLVRLALSPESRHFFYPVLEDANLPAMVVFGAMVLLAACVGAVAMLRKRSFTGFLLAAFFLLCVPYLQLIPAKPPSLVSDRYVALAVWPVVLLIVSLAWRLKPAFRAAVLLAIALPWAYQTIERPQDWRSPGTLIDADLNAYSWHYLPALYKINQILLPQGLYREARETASKIADPEMKSMANELIQSDYAVYSYAWSTGKTDAAIASLWSLDAIRKQTPARIRWNPSMAFIWESIRIRIDIRWKYLAGKFPADALVRYNTGLWLLNNGKYDEAATHLRAATELSPRDTKAYCSLAEVYRHTGREEDAARAETECHHEKVMQ